MLLTAIWAILIFCFLIFIHEFGHFFTAKLSGMTVHEFSIGMGPKLFGFKKRETLYSLRILPLGGFVKLEGEDGESADSNAFCNKSAMKRFFVLFAGAFMNVIFGFLIFVVIFTSASSVATNNVGEVAHNSAFYDAGIKPGDKIIHIKGDKLSTGVHSFRDVSFFISINGAAKAEFTFERNSDEFKKVITPRPLKDGENPVFGLTASVEKVSFFSALSLAFWECIFVIKSVFLSLWWLISGAIPMNAMSGPVAIVGEIGTAAKYGWQSVLNLAGFISVNLGVMNLLPIPALDGGRILFLIIEKIRGKKMNPEREGMVNFIFFAFLILLMLFVTLSDIKKLF